MNLTALFSGGKDSTYSTYLYFRDISILLAIEDEPDSMLFHTPNIGLTRKLAEGMGKEILYCRAEAVKDAFTELRDRGIDGVVCGALASNYQRRWVEGLCEDFGLKAIFPLWHKPGVELFKELIELEFDVVITSVSAEGLGREWLGKHIDRITLELLEERCRKYRIDPGFEGGEAETIVLNAPVYKRGFMIKKAKVHWRNRTGWYEILEIEGLSF